MNCFNEEQLNRISHLVREIGKLSDVEKLFLYLQLPCGRVEGAEGLEGKTKLNNHNGELFAKKPDQETTQTYTWILSHLEVDPNVSLPKQEVYDEYKAFCQANRFDPLCVADFGKAMKHAFPCIKPRRLGQRGNSRYCYSGLRKKYKIQPPNLPDMIEPTFCMANDCSQTYNQLIKDCGDNPAECPLNNRPNVPTNEVINLKIEQRNQHFQTSRGTMNINTCNETNCNTNYIVTQQQTNDKQTTGGSSSGSNIQDINDRQQQQPPPTSLALSNAPMNHNFVVSNPIPVNNGTPISRYSDYVGIIQQPGTPDDDDYRHNYQDALPIERHLFPSSSMTSVVGQSQPQLTGNFMRLDTTADKQALVNDGNQRMMDLGHRGTTTGSVIMANQSDNLQQQQQQQAFSTNLDNNSGLISGEPSVVPPTSIAAPSSSGIVMDGSQVHHFTHINGSMMDSCASPFQSPASTPYPMMSSYMGADIQDYYPTNDCIRYTS